MTWFTISAAFFRFLLSGLDKRHLAAVLLENDKILRQLWQGLPFLSQISYMHHRLLCRKSSFLLERGQNRRTFASSFRQTTFFDLLIQITIKEVQTAAPPPRCLHLSVSPLLTQERDHRFLPSYQKRCTKQHFKIIIINKYKQIKN